MPRLSEPAVANTWETRTLHADTTATGNLSIAFDLAPGSVNAAWLDNVAVDVSVPEPATLSLLMGASGLMLLRRRGGQ